MDYDVLSHHGILGMRWGIHRSSSQSSTSGVTSKTQKKSVKDLSDEALRSNVVRLNLEKQYKTLNKENQPTSKVKKIKKVVDATSTLTNQAKNLTQKTAASSKPMDLSKMTDQQLRDRINRTNLEKQYSTLFGSEGQTVSKGQQYASKILDTAGTALAVGSSALGIALAIKELKK